MEHDDDTINGHLVADLGLSPHPVLPFQYPEQKHCCSQRYVAQHHKSRGPPPWVPGREGRRTNTTVIKVFCSAECLEKAVIMKQSFIRVCCCIKFSQCFMITASSRHLVEQNTLITVVLVQRRSW